MKVLTALKLAVFLAACVLCGTFRPQDLQTDKTNAAALAPAEAVASARRKADWLLSAYEGQQQHERKAGFRTFSRDFVGGDGVGLDSRCSRATRSAVGSRVAVCFYGLNRSLRHTIESVRALLYAPLREACVEVDTFFHTWSVEQLEDASAVMAVRKVTRLGGAAEELALLRGLSLARHAISDQDAFDRSIAANLTDYANVDSRYVGVNFRNMLRQLESLRIVTELWGAEASARRASADDEFYTSVLYLRPDLRLLDRFDVPQLLGLSRSELLTPYWHQWSGINDRIAGGAPGVARAFGTRIELLSAYARVTFVRSESFVKWVMLTSHRVKLVLLATRAVRVRASGAVADNDFCLSWCSLELKKVCRGDCRRLVPLDEAPPLAEWAQLQQQRNRLKLKDTTRRRVRDAPVAAESNNDAA